MGRRDRTGVTITSHSSRHASNQYCGNTWPHDHSSMRCYVTNSSCCSHNQSIYQFIFTMAPFTTVFPEEEISLPVWPLSLSWIFALTVVLLPSILTSCFALIFRALFVSRVIPELSRTILLPLESSIKMPPSLSSRTTLLSCYAACQALSRYWGCH